MGIINGTGKLVQIAGDLIKGHWFVPGGQEVGPPFDEGAEDADDGADCARDDAKLK